MTQIALDEKREATLQRMAQQRQVPLAHLIEQAIDDFIIRAEGKRAPEDMASKKQPATTKVIDRDQELDWLAKHRDEFAGQWVALDGGRLVSHGAIVRDVVAEAERQGVRFPLVVQVEPADELPFAGW